MPERLDRNQTVWQRLRVALAGALPIGRPIDLDEITRALHPYVIAERDDARGDTHG